MLSVDCVDKTFWPRLLCAMLGSHLPLSGFVHVASFWFVSLSFAPPSAVGVVEVQTDGTVHPPSADALAQLPDPPFCPALHLVARSSENP